MQSFWALFDKLVDIMAALAGAILIFITLAVCYTIGMRFFFTKTTIWIMPAAEYALLWIVFLATTWLLRENGHICTDIIHAHLRTKTRGCLDCAMFVMAGIACAVMLLLGSLHVFECIARGVTDVRAVTVPRWVVFIIIPVGSGFLTAQFIRMAWSRWSDIRTGR